jgi:hypothetical protein
MMKCLKYTVDKDYGKNKGIVASRLKMTAGIYCGMNGGVKASFYRRREAKF